MGSRKGTGSGPLKVLRTFPELDMHFVVLLVVGSITLFCPSFSASHTPSKFKGSRVWFHHSGVGRGVQRFWKPQQSKRSLSSFRNNQIWDEKEKKSMNSLLGFHHPMRFHRETRMTSFHPHLRGIGRYEGREKRGGVEQGVWKLQDCMTVSSKEEGIWEYKSDGRTETCGLYLVTKPDQLVEITLHQIDVDCDSGLVVVFDGWELNGNVFPGDDDHPLDVEARSTLLCSGTAQKKVFVSSQNAALVSFKIPKEGQGFRISVKYIPNKDPCNILMSDMVGLFTLQNNGKARNCSLTTLLFPANFELMSVAVGAASLRHRRALGTSGLSSQCSPDFVELGGSSELDSVNLATSQTLCGTETKPEKGLTVLCGSSTVRLVSSGEFDNSVTVLVKAATDDDLNYEKNMIMTCPEFMQDTA